MEHVVGIGGFAVSKSPDDIIKTFALSTCVGLVMFSMRKRCLGMAHIQLPECRRLGSDKPSRFADIAPEFMINEMKRDYNCTARELLISLYGGIDSKGPNDCFRIGEKNLANVKAKLKALGLVYNEVDTGGQESRTLIAYSSTGVVEVIKRPMAFQPGSMTQRQLAGQQRPQFGSQQRPQFGR
jgi:chemotaxis protein CheD